MLDLTTLVQEDVMTAEHGPLGRLELLQGTLDLIILQTLAWGPQHGYGLTQMIQVRSGDVLQVETGSLYPALHRLEKKKLIRASWERSDNNQRVRVYELTAAGRRQLAAVGSRWERLSEAMQGIMSPSAAEEDA